MTRDERQEVLTIDAKDQNVGLFVEPPNKKLEVISKQEKPAMTTLREAAQQALEALIDAQRHHYALKHKETDDLVATLRAALAEQVKAAMTRDDIIRMAREAGLSNEIGAFGYPYLPELERFAALVAAGKDREIERLQDMLYEQLGELTALRAEKQMRGYIEQLKGSVAETTLDVSGTTCFSPAPAKWPERSVEEEEQPK